MELSKSMGPDALKSQIILPNTSLRASRTFCSRLWSADSFQSRKNSLWTCRNCGCQSWGKRWDEPCLCAALTAALHAEGCQFDPCRVYFPLQWCAKWGARWGQARLGRQNEASQSSSIMGSRDAGPMYGTKQNLILAGPEPAIFDSEDQRLMH